MAPAKRSAQCIILVSTSLMVMMLISCTPKRAPLRIKHISVYPEPVVGKNVTLSIEIVSSNDEPETTFSVIVPEGVKVMGGETTWQGSLFAKQVQSFDIPICVLYEGEWRILVQAYSRLAVDSTYGDYESLFLQSTYRTGKTILERDYRITMPPGGFQAATVTPLPPPDPAVCP